MGFNRLMVLLGGLFLLVGSLLPWASVSAFGRSTTLMGIAVGGIIPAVAAIVLLVVAAVNRDRPGLEYSLIGVIASLVAGGVLFYKIADVLLATGPSFARASIGVGLLLVSPVGAVLAFIGSVMKVPVIPPPPPQDAEEAE